MEVVNKYTNMHNVYNGIFMFIKCILNKKCLLYNKICTTKLCKLILNYSDIFHCQYTLFREFTVMLAKVMN